MRMVQIPCYKFGELDEDAKQLAIEDTIQFVLERYTYEEQSENIQKAIDAAERMKTPWFTGSYIWEYAEDEILHICNQYEYTENGSVFPFHLIDKIMI